MAKRVASRKTYESGPARDSSRGVQRCSFGGPRTPLHPGASLRARGRTKHEGPNKVEREYAENLERRRIAGEIAWWAFEPAKLALAFRCTYLPDFLVVLADGTVEFHEVKTTWRSKAKGDRAGWQEDARVKIKVAARKFWPFRFVAAIRTRDGWDFEEIKP